MRREIEWDEENRIRRIKDKPAGAATHTKGQPATGKDGVTFTYDDAGERVVKKTNETLNVYVNQFSTAKGASKQTKGMVFVKHIFAGNTRLISKVIPGGYFEEEYENKQGIQKDLTGLKRGDLADGKYVTVIEDTMVHRGASGDSQTWGPAEACRQFKLLDTKLHNKVYLRIEYDSPAKQGFIDSRSVVIGDASECGANYPPSGSVLPKVLPEDNFIFYYHPDHLGSTGYMTDRIGRVYEHLQYTPWGETWVEQRRGKDLFPKYQFTGKELDPETNLYYFGARYYDPQTSVWASTDPALGDYLRLENENKKNPLARRVFKSINMSSYHYAEHNPTRYSDPNGLFNIETGEIEKGDTLSDITLQINSKFDIGLTVADIAKANNVENQDYIQAGDYLVLPGKNVLLFYDGDSVSLKDNTYDLLLGSYPAVSGIPGVNDYKLKNAGPIPPGEYLLNPSEISKGGFFRNLLGDWGKYRAPLHSQPTTNTFNRSGFFIHGGRRPGSAGCIDVGENDVNLFPKLKNAGGTIPVIVNYGVEK